MVALIQGPGTGRGAISYEAFDVMKQTQGGHTPGHTGLTNGVAPAKELAGRGSQSEKGQLRPCVHTDSQGKRREKSLTDGRGGAVTKTRLRGPRLLTPILATQRGQRFSTREPREHCTSLFGRQKNLIHTRSQFHRKNTGKIASEHLAHSDRQTK